MTPRPRNLLPHPEQPEPVAGGPVVTPRSKVRPPAARAGQLRRDRLLTQLAHGTTDLVLVLAPAGYGKTTLMAQWAMEAGRPVAWATVTGIDDDPLVLMSTVLAALGESGASLTAPPSQLTSDEPAFSRHVLPAFQRALESLECSVTLVVDDIHTMPGARAALVLSAVLDALPPGSQMALIGRARPDLPIALWRSQGRVQELGQDDLSFDARETTQFLAGLPHEQEIDPKDARDLLESTGGWPVAVYLDSRSGRLSKPGSGPALGEYIETVVLGSADDHLVDFLRQSSVLSAMSGVACDHVLETTGSHERLRTAERATLLVTRLADDDEYFRLHPLLREQLSRELREADRGRWTALQARAAGWCDEHGYVDDAIAHAAESDDAGLLGEVIWKHAPAALILGRHTTVQGWLSSVDAETAARTPTLAITLASSALMRSDGALARTWMQAAATALGPDWRDHLNRSTVEPALATLVALSGADGFEASAALAGAAYEGLPPTHPIRPLAAFITGVHLLLSGRETQGRATIELARDLARAMELGTTWVGTSTLLAALDVQDGEWARAEEEIAEARRVWAQHRLDDGIATAWSLAVSAFFHARAGADEQARRDIERVEAMIARYSSLLPWVRVVVDSFLTRAYAALGEEAAAVSTLRRVEEILDRVETSAFLTALAVAAEQPLRRADVLKSLSPAELRLWPHAAGRGTVREIAAALHVSPETVKTQLSSIYRKLGVRSRRELQELAESLEA